MVSITVSVPDETRELMQKFPEMNWSGFVRKSIEEKAKELSLKEELLKRVKSEENFAKWAVELGKKAKKGRLQKLLKKDESD